VIRPRFLAFTIAALLASPIIAAEKKPATPTATPAAKPAATKALADRGWPREYTVGDADVILYQPQIEGWQNDVVKARFAVGIKVKGAKNAAYGSFRLIAETMANHETRVVTLFNSVIEDVKFPGGEDARYAKYIESLLPERPVTVALDRLLAGLPEEDVLTENTPVTDLKAQVPKLFLSTEPAVLVVFDGAPIFKALAGTGLDAAVNTPWPVLRVTGKDEPTFLLNSDNLWVTADKLDGDWKPAGTAPAGLAKIPAEHPLAKIKEGKVVSAKVPVANVIVSEEPAELIVLKGKPKLRPVGSLPLLQVSNTGSALFFNTEDAIYYTLIAGRWFAAMELKGPWGHVPYEALPDSFGKIPENDAAAFVMASVPGTRAAIEAVKEAQIPEKAPVNRKTPPKVTVEYDGEPKFEPIEGTTMKYATNTSYDVIYAENSYYCCHNGVWFVATAPVRTAWVLATAVPKIIFGIPPRYPVYRCTFVRVYDVSDDVIIYGYTAGYRGVYIAPTCVVAYGTGYYYRPWISAGAYYGYPWTYGAGVAYRPYTGGFVAGAAWSSGPGVTVARAGYNPWTGNYGAGYRTTTPYGSWGRGVVGNGDDWVQAGYARGARGGVAGARNSDGDYAVVAHSNRRDATVGVFNDDLYAAKDGNVVRRTDDGWQKYDDGGWEDVDRSNLSGDWEDRAKNRSSTQSYKGADGKMYQREGGELKRFEDGKWNNVNAGGAQDRRDAVVKDRPRPEQLSAGAKDRAAQKPAQLPANAKDGAPAKPAQLPATKDRVATQPANRPDRAQLQQKYERPAEVKRPEVAQRSAPAQRSEAPARHNYSHQFESRDRGNARASQFQSGGGSRSAFSSGGGGMSRGGGGRAGGGGGRGGRR
jgi:uncharacterized membrane protein YgcG